MAPNMIEHRTLKNVSKAGRYGEAIRTSSIVAAVNACAGIAVQTVKAAYVSRITHLLEYA